MEYIRTPKTLTRGQFCKVLLKLDAGDDPLAAMLLVDYYGAYWGNGVRGGYAGVRGGTRDTRGYEGVRGGARGYEVVRGGTRGWYIDVYQGSVCTGVRRVYYNNNNATIPYMASLIISRCKRNRLRWNTFFLRYRPLNNVTVLFLNHYPI